MGRRVRKITPTVPIIAMLFNTGVLLILFNSGSVFVNAKFRDFSTSNKQTHFQSFFRNSEPIQKVFFLIEQLIIFISGSVFVNAKCRDFSIGTNKLLELQATTFLNSEVDIKEIRKPVI